MAHDVPLEQIEEGMRAVRGPSRAQIGTVIRHVVVEEVVEDGRSCPATLKHDGVTIVKRDIVFDLGRIVHELEVDAIARAARS